ncbi:MAG: class I SAM-dependent methyltransferase [Melioribacteraceae bacterium]|nr:class I SAM-dependent methyltransferase [Melioribacteraceae bacterium]
MNELELLVDFHKDAQRQGPGSHQTTIKTLDFISSRNNHNLKILDIGCGTGAQTISLAQNTDSKITAVDLFPEFLEKLDQRALIFGLGEAIKTVQASMEKLPFEENSFDIIWSEGAIYNMGFEAGIQYWKKFLKPGGYMAISEITWFTDSRPSNLDAHWQNAYPQINTASNNIELLEKNNLSPVAYFQIPKECWIDNYYTPMKNRFNAFLERHAYSEAAKTLIENEKEEINLYESYSEFYGYGFYINRKN